MAHVFGVDFGTTNSLASVVVEGKLRDYVGPDGLPHPSVVWYHGASTTVGRNAREQLAQATTGVVGDVVRSPKSFLGSGTHIHVAGVAREPSDVVAEIFRHLRADVHARTKGRLPLDRAVVTIPVNMDGRARRDLREAALKAGVHIAHLVHEPLAALYGYLRAQPDYQRRLAELENQVALVFDWGGGTLDITLCRFSSGALIQIQNKGDNAVGGDRFDERILRHVQNEHTRMHRLATWPDAMPGADAKLLAQCEYAKIELSTRSEARLLVENYLRSDGPERHLKVVLTRATLIDLVKDIVLDGVSNIDRVLDAAGMAESAIALCLATGGVVRTPYVRERLIERFGIARLPEVTQSDRIIAQGAAWIAQDGLRLRLAKPFEVLHADNGYIPLVPEGTELPMDSVRFSMYCVDPRDGFAKFQLARPRLPGRSAPSDPRSSYATLAIRVDATASPMLERLELEIGIDTNLVARVMARSAGDSQATEIHDLEFGLSIAGPRSPGGAPGGRASSSGGATGTSDQGINTGDLPPDPRLRRHTTFGQTAPGAVRLRSNVTTAGSAWFLVPGEIVEKYRPLYFRREQPPAFQEEERDFYVPCSMCKRLRYQFMREGCESCHIMPHPPPPLPMP